MPTEPAPAERCVPCHLAFMEVSSRVRSGGFCPVPLRVASFARMPSAWRCGRSGCVVRALLGACVGPPRPPGWRARGRLQECRAYPNWLAAVVVDLGFGRAAFVS